MAAPKRSFIEKRMNIWDLRRTIKPNPFQRFAAPIQRAIGRWAIRRGSFSPRMWRWARLENERIDSDRIMPRFGHERRDQRSADALSYVATRLDKPKVEQLFAEMMRGTYHDRQIDERTGRPYSHAILQNITHLHDTGQLEQLLTSPHMQEALATAAGRYIIPRRTMTILTSGKTRVRNVLVSALVRSAEMHGVDLTAPREQPRPQEPAPAPEPAPEPEAGEQEGGQSQAQAQATNVTVQGGHPLFPGAPGQPVIIQNFYGTQPQAGAGQATRQPRPRQPPQSGQQQAAGKLAPHLGEFTGRQDAGAGHVNDFVRLVAAAHLDAAEKMKTGRKSGGSVAQALFTGLTPLYSPGRLGTSKDDSIGKKQRAAERILAGAGVADHEAHAPAIARAFHQVQEVAERSDKKLPISASTPAERAIAIGHRFKDSLPDAHAAKFASLVSAEIRRQAKERAQQAAA